MRKLLTCLIVGAVAASASVASAANPRFVSFPSLQPAPPPAPAADGVVIPDGAVVPHGAAMPYGAPMPYGMMATPDPLSGGAVPLFHAVRYKDLDEMAPCAVPMIIQVPDPCACQDPCNCCAPQCVAIQICVPPCGCEPRIKSNRRGNRIEYCFGEYAVDVRVKRGYIEVDYQD